MQWQQHVVGIFPFTVTETESYVKGKDIETQRATLSENLFQNVLDLIFGQRLTFPEDEAYHQENTEVVLRNLFESR